MICATFFQLKPTVEAVVYHEIARKLPYTLDADLVAVHRRKKIKVGVHSTRNLD